MNTEGIIKRLSEKAGTKMKASEKIVSAILESAETDLEIGMPFSLEGVGTVRKANRKTQIENLSDGSCRVKPPSAYAEFRPYREDDSLISLRSSQRTISILASGVTENYKQAEKAYREFTKIIRKALRKGRKVKIAGIGTFSVLSGPDNGEQIHVGFEASGKLNGRLNDCFALLEEKITFPIPPLALTDGGNEAGNKLSKKEILVDQAADENDPIKRKLAMISQDLIRLHEEINSKTKKDDGSGLWG